VPPHAEDPSFYSDWGDPREFTTGDLGAGECAGAVVAPVEFELAACERELFEAQLRLDAGNPAEASVLANRAMRHGAAALLRHKAIPFEDTADGIAAQFRTHLYDTRLFWDRFVGGNLAQYYFKAHEGNGVERNAEAAHEFVEEAQLFIDACHSCYLTMSGATVR
jgi:sulfite reductase (ferredoxin)